MAKVKLPPVQLDDKTAEEIVEQLWDESSDRSCAIIAGELLNGALRVLLEAFLVDPKPEIFDGSSPILETFSSREVLAYHVGLLSAAERADVGLIRGIRNAFGHHLDVRLSFQSREISSRVSSLQATRIKVTKKLAAAIEAETGAQVTDDAIQSFLADPRSRFIFAVGILAAAFLRRATIVQRPSRIGPAQEIVARLAREQEEQAEQTKKTLDAYFEQALTKKE